MFRLFLVLSFLVAPFAQANEIIQNFAHSAADSDQVIDLYNITEPSAELDALPDPSGGGFEYWPYIYDEDSNSHPHPYPDLIQWGFSAGSEQAQRCMKLSWHIWDYVQSLDLQHLGALMQHEDSPNGYFHWNNDFTQANHENQGFRTFWHYRRPGGLLKWISHTKIDGSCHHPTVEAIERWSWCELQKLNQTDEQCSGHN